MLFRSAANASRPNCTFARLKAWARMSFWAELRRRNVFRVGAVYLASAWVLSQVGSLVAQSFAAPAWPMRMLPVLIAIGWVLPAPGSEPTASSVATGEIQMLAQKQDIGAGGWASAHLGIGDPQKALEQLRLGARHARRHVLDSGSYTLTNIRMNPTRDPVLEQPEFAAVRAALTGD